MASTSTTAQAVAQAVRHRMVDHGLTRHSLSLASGVSLSTLRRRLAVNNPAPMPVDELESIARVLGTTPLDIMTEASRLAEASAA